MDSFQTPFWELPIAFAMNESARNRIGEMTDEEREVLRQKSSLAGSEEELEKSVVCTDRCASQKSDIPRRSECARDCPRNCD